MWNLKNGKKETSLQNRLTDRKLWLFLSYDNIPVLVTKLLLSFPDMCVCVQVCTVDVGHEQASRWGPLPTVITCSQKSVCNFAVGSLWMWFHVHSFNNCGPCRTVACVYWENNLQLSGPLQLKPHCSRASCFHLLRLLEQMTTTHGAKNTQNVFFPSSGGSKSDIKVSAGLFSFWDSGWSPHSPLSSFWSQRQAWVFLGMSVHPCSVPSVLTCVLPVCVCVWVFFDFLLFVRTLVLMN